MGTSASSLLALSWAVEVVAEGASEGSLTEGQEIQLQAQVLEANSIMCHIAGLQQMDVHRVYFSVLDFFTISLCVAFSYAAVFEDKQLGWAASLFTCIALLALRQVATHFAEPFGGAMSGEALVAYVDNVLCSLTKLVS